MRVYYEPLLSPDDLEFRLFPDDYRAGTSYAKSVVKSLPQHKRFNAARILQLELGVGKSRHYVATSLSPHYNIVAHGLNQVVDSFTMLWKEPPGELA